MRILRWILVVPGALVCMMLGGTVGGVIGALLGGQRGADTLGALLGSFLVIIGASLIAPPPHEQKVGIAMVAIMVVLPVFTIVYSRVSTAAMAIHQENGGLPVSLAHILAAASAFTILRRSHGTSVRERLGVVLAVVSMPVLVLLGAAIHVWTIVIAFQSGGLIPAVVSLLVPVLAQLYWGLCLWQATGTLANPFCTALGVYFVAWIVAGLAGFLGEAKANRA